MPSIKDLWPDRWLKPAVLQHRVPSGRVRVAIEAVSIEPVHNPRTRREKPHLIVAFHGKELRMILNKTQATALVTITRTDDYTEWIGHEIVLSVGEAPNGMEPIVISPIPDGLPNPSVSALDDPSA